MNYIQSNVNLSTVDFNFSQTSLKTSEKSISELSFADALKSAYKSEKISESDSKVSTPDSYQSNNIENAVNEEATASEKTAVSENKENKETVDGKNISKSEKIAKNEDKSESSDKDVDSSNLQTLTANSQNSEKIIADNIENDELELKIDLGNTKVAVNNSSDVDDSVEDFDVEALISEKMAKFSDSKDTFETKNSHLEQNDVVDTNKISDIQISNIASDTLKVAKKENSLKTENGFEKISIHDLRTRKIEDDNLDSLKIVKSKLSKIESKNEKDGKKVSKTNSDVKNSKLLDTNQLSHKTKGVKNVTPNELKVAYNQESQDSVQFTMELAAKANQNITSSSAQTAAANGSDFQQMLSNTIQHNASEFVKAGNIVLKDGNQGTINLILKPESLGNVKISLSLSDKTISGQIIVTSKDAYDAFRENIEAIKQAFTQSGFDTGSFDLNFSNQQNFAQGGQGDNTDAQNLNQQNAVSHADKSYGDLVVSEEIDASSYENSGSHSVNIVA